MAITVEWDNAEQTIALMRFGSTWNWDELYLAIDKYNSMVEKSPYQVQMIVEIPVQKSLPPNFLFYGREVSRQMSPHSWGGVIVTRSQPLRLIIKTLRNLRDPSALRFQMSDSVEAARQLLEKSSSGHH